MNIGSTRAPSILLPLAFINCSSTLAFVVPGLAWQSRRGSHTAQLEGKTEFIKYHNVKYIASIDYGVHREYEAENGNETIGKLEHLKVLFRVKCGIIRLEGDFYLGVGRDSHIHGVFDV